MLNNVDANSSGTPHQSSEDPVISTPPTWWNLAALFTGSTFEWLDWTCYIIFSKWFAPEFFPGVSPSSAERSALIVFAIGSFFRPVGGFLLGGISDLYGRKPALILSILAMAGGGLLFGLAPTGSIMGVVLLVVSRVIQGMATGGEFAAYVSYLAEVVPERVRGKYSSSAYVTSTLGVTLATVFLLELGWHLSPAGQDRWGWRVPFIFASTVAIIGFYLRVTLIEESKYFEADRGATVPRLTMEVLRSLRGQLRETVRDYSGTSLRMVGFTVAPTVVYYAILSYLPLDMQARPYYLPPTRTQEISVAAQFLLIIVLIPVGILSDRIGRKPLLIAFAAGYMFLIVPLWTILGNSWWRLLVVMCCSLLLFSLYAAPGPTAMAELFPTHVRSSGLGLPYSATVGVFGGTGPLLLNWLTGTGQRGYFPWYVAALSLISLFTYVTTKETKGRFPSRLR